MKKFIAKLLYRMTGRLGKSSISDNGAYPKFCLSASREDDVFAEFRRNRIYNEILEHVTEAQGRRYLEIASADAALMSLIERFKENDAFGGPLTIAYPNIGAISPSTLRYIKVLFDLKSHFGPLDGFDICEIGVGYGGQCRIVDVAFKPASYTLVDLDPVLRLTRRYLQNFTVAATLHYRTMRELDDRGYDLAISNIAFTELPRAIQNEYLAKIILRSKRGYITYNEISPPEFHSYSAEELIRIIPGSERFNEDPLTHPKNCIIIWNSGAGEKNV
jgi:phospholipid N-methyltransferase